MDLPNDDGMLSRGTSRNLRLPNRSAKASLGNGSVVVASVGAVTLQCAVDFKSRRIGLREAVEFSVGLGSTFHPAGVTAGLIINAFPRRWCMLHHLGNTWYLVNTPPAQ